MRIVALQVVFALLIFGHLSEAAAQEGSVKVYRCEADGMRHYRAHPVAGESCVAITTRPVQQQLSGPPSILSQCLDVPSGNVLVGPSARARECTRQICAQQKYRALVSAYAMSQPQTELDQRAALTCITRAEQDLRR
jgi:hypothetical protein